MSFNVSVDGTTTQDINFKYTTTDVVATNGTFDNLTATNGTISNLTFNTFSPSNINTTNLVANDITTDNMNATTSNITTLTSTNGNISNANITGGSATLSTGTLTTANITTANITESNHTGRIRLNYNGGDTFIFNDVGAGNLHIQSSDDNIILQPNNNDSGNGKVELDGDLEVEHELFIGTSSKAKIYQDINKLYIEADIANALGKDIILRPQTGVDTEAVKIISGNGYGLLETDKVRVDDIEFSYLNQIVDLETTLTDLNTNSITFFKTSPFASAVITQDNIGRLSLISSTDDIYLQAVANGRVQINSNLKIAGAGSQIQLASAEIDDYPSNLLIAAQNKDITLRPKQGYSAEDVIIKSGLGYSQLQCNTIIASTLQLGIGAVNVGTELTSLQTQINGKQNTLTNTSNVIVQNLSAVDDLTAENLFMTGSQNSLAFSATRKDYVDGLIATKQNTLTAGTNISIVGNTISATAGSVLTATTPVDITNNVISVLLDTSPTLASTKLINSGNIKNSIDLKQDILTTSSNIHINNIDLNGDLFANRVFSTGTQSTSATAVTRKDYVDTQLLTKQDELVAQGGVKIDSATNIITSDNESIIVDNFADVYQNIATINTYITRLGYTRNFTTAGSGVLNNGFTYPQLSNTSVDGFLQKTLPNYAGNAEVRLGNSGSGFCKVLLDGVQKGSAFTNQTDILINFTFTANQVLKITQETNAILTLYHVKIKNHIALEAQLPVKISGTTISFFEDSVPTQGSDNFLSSGDIFTALATKQNTITTSTNIDAFDITALNDLVGADAFVTNSQSSVSNSLTRKDYVDTQVATKQNTLTTSTNLNVNNIDCNQLDTQNLKIYDIGNTTLALIAHPSMASSNSYTMGINQGGDTILNVNSSGQLKYTINGTTNIAQMDATGIIIQSGKDLYRGTTSLTTDLAAKQDTITATDGVKLDGTTIKADNRTIVIDDLANVYSTFTIVSDYLTGLGYTLTDMNNIIPPYIQRGAFFYPRLYGSVALNGRIEKTLPNFNGQLEINYGNGNVNNGFVKIYLDNVLQDTATQTEQDKTLVVDFTPNQVLKLEETTSGAIIIYQIITRQRLAIPFTKSRLSNMSYYSRNVGGNIGSGIINFYPSTYNYVLNDLGIAFTTQVDGNSSTGWLLPIGTYKIHYKYSIDNRFYSNRLGVRCVANMSGTDYAQSIAFSYGRDNDFIDKQSVQADFIYVASSATYMRLRLNCAKNNNTYNSDWDNTSILEGSSIIIEKID